MPREQKTFKKYRTPLAPLPNLVSVQLESYRWLLKSGLREIFDEFSPIKDYSEGKFELTFGELKIEAPRYDEHYAKANNLSYDASLKVNVVLKNLTLKNEKEQEIFMADFPLMTEHGTFIINGVEKVVVPQLARSFGVFFTAHEHKGKVLFGAKIIPARGAWIEIETDPDESIYARIDRKRKFPVTALLRALAETPLDATDEAITEQFHDIPADAPYIEHTLKKDHAKSKEDAYLEIYRKLRDSELITATNAKTYITDLLSTAKYDLSLVGRYRFNTRFGKGTGTEDFERRTLSFDDLVTTIKHIISLNRTPGAEADDIDHMGLRRVRAVGEMLQARVRVGLAQLKRNIQDKMSTVDTSTTMPILIVSPRPLQARLKEFFNTNQLSQFMSQENVLSELEHLRRLSALGPGGLTRERSGFEVRDVHSSHYG